MIYLFLADGFEEIEALTPVDVLRRAGLEVRTVSVSGKTKVEGSHGINVEADLTLSECGLTGAEMLILPGGKTGTQNLRESEKLASLLLDADKRGLYLAAICAAPSVLGKLGLLRGVRAVCYPGNEKWLEGAQITDADVVRDGRYVTARGMGVSLQFALELVKVLRGDEAAREIAASVQMNAQSRKLLGA